MAWITTHEPARQTGPAHASRDALALLAAGIGIRFRLVGPDGGLIAVGRWLNTPDCEPAEHPHRQPLTALAARHRDAAIEYETAPGLWQRH